jgi:hypothetical protein
MAGLLSFLVNHTPLFYFVQSFWRDEAYSALFVLQPVSDIIARSSFEPPVYYLLLHFWIKLVGESEIAVRSLSFIGYALSVIVVIHWAEERFSRHWLSWFTPLFYAINPMILYYAFEARAYGWYMFFITSALYAYSRKSWRMFISACVLGFYTHLYMVFVPFVTAIHYAITNWRELRSKTPRELLWDPMVRCLIIAGVGMSPWFVRIASEASRMSSSWYYPVDLQLVKSVIGNMFIGYEGTPWFLWSYTRSLSLVLLGFFLLALVPKKTRTGNLYYFLMALVPLTVIIGISFVLKPLYVNRYLMPAAVAEVLLVPLGIAAIRPETVKRILGSLMIAGIVAFSCWYPQQHRKQDMRSVMQEINRLAGPKDFIYAGNAIIYPEVMYYATNRHNVYLYNPAGAQFPWFIGDAIFSANRSKASYPPYPYKAFLVAPDGSYQLVSETGPYLTGPGATQ